MTSKLTILVSGMIATVPRQGGATWAVLQYLLGFKQLGHDVYFVEPVSSSALQPLDVPFRHSTNATYFREVMRQYGFDDSAALLLAGTQHTVGLSYTELISISQRADVLINIAGMLTDGEITDRIPARVYLDLDPAFTQLWHAAQGIDMRFAGHTHFVTIGQTLGESSCAVPTCGLAWIPTLQPIVLSWWPKVETHTSDALTTVAHWRGYGSIAHEGAFYGQKAHALRPLIDLPRRTKEQFLLALAIDPDDRNDLEALRSNGWKLLDPACVTATPTTFQQFIQRSKAEFGIAKGGYIVSQAGWFSDRSVCYLASGRPVIAMETGFSRFLPVGSGLFGFTTSDEALASIEVLNSDYAGHALSARAIAEEYFDADKVLVHLLRTICVA